ncbi:MAG TPA: UDP-glucose/GDP-mannose dehydrogenase family protein [Rectinemataceae bacterium]|nr:UDP-glucose/GDP-mannose dehydrogenase family protein [Rectinemataceae bacterium]
MHIAMIGTGYVGLVSGTCFAEMGNSVWCIDVDAKKIEGLKKGVLPIYEPGLEEMVHRNAKEGRLKFTTNFSEAIPGADICFIAVGTPPGEDGSADTRYVLSAAASIAREMSGYTVVVDKSTVPVGTSEVVRATMAAELAKRAVAHEFDVVSNPEFLKEGVAIEDFLRPDRVVVGCDSPRAERKMRELYEPFIRNQHPILFMDIKSAEITKYAANAMLATRISFMNEIAELCDKVGGDINNIRLGIGSDARIGMSFLYAGTGYGGSCFPKDVKELVAVGARNGVDMEIIRAVEAVNERQKFTLVRQVIEHFGERLDGRTFAIWGLAFKPQTDDMREAPAVVIINELVARGARIKAYDPEAFAQAAVYLGQAKDAIEYVEDQYEVLEGADALILVTEWKQFRQPDFEIIRGNLKGAIIFDGRNQYDPSMMKSLAFEYHCIGRNAQ